MTGSSPQHTVDERTSLLRGRNLYPSPVPSDSPCSTDPTLNNTVDHPEIYTGITDANIIIAESNPEIQETNLKPSPTYGSIKNVARSTSVVTIGSDHTDRNDHVKPESPYLSGVSKKRFWVIFIMIMTSYFIACFDTTIMASSHPVITSYFHSSNSASWLSTAFMLTSTGFQPLFGGLSDTIGRRRPYMFSISIFLMATIWCALAGSMTSFIFARAMCGLGAGGIITMSTIIISDLVPIKIRGIYQSYINVAFGAGQASGVALGGWIADSVGWRWEFGIQVPLVLACCLTSFFVIPERLGLASDKEANNLWQAMKGFDFMGSSLLMTSTTFLILGLNLGGNIYSWTHPIVISSLVIFLISFPLFFYVESFAARPIMPLRIITKNPRAGLIFANATSAVVLSAVNFNIPLFFQAVMLQSATNSGLNLLAPSISASFAGVGVGFLITWTKHLKLFLVLGALISVMGCFGLSFIQRGLPTWVYLPFLMNVSIGQGLIFPTTFMSVLSVSEQSDQAVVASTLVLWRSIGNFIGISLSSLALQNSLIVFLNRYVQGPDRDNVIESVRKSIEVIKDLAPSYKEQVLDSYTAALRATFFLVLVMSIICLVTFSKVKLPRLGKAQ